MLVQLSQALILAWCEDQRGDSSTAYTDEPDYSASTTPTTKISAHQWAEACVGHCIIPYGTMQCIALYHMGACQWAEACVVHCIIPYGTMQCIALYHMGACQWAEALSPPL